MNFNLVHSVEDISEDSGPAAEPVTLQEVKDYLRLEGFSADDDSPADEFDFDDTLIERIIVAGRQWCEAKTGCSLVTKLINAYVTNLSGRLSVPAGPVTGTITAVNSDGDAIDSESIKVVGTKFPELVLPKQADMTLTYEAGYTPTTIPKGLKMAILAYCAAVYENRGDEDQADLKQARQLCGPYIKYSAWA